MSRPGDKSVRELYEMLNRWSSELHDWNDSRPKSADLPWLNNIHTTVLRFILWGMMALQDMRPNAVDKAA